MKIPTRHYTLESFLEYVAGNLEDVFEGRNERKWLKAHLIFVAKEWKTIFSDLTSETLGDVTRIRFESTKTDGIEEVPTDFYIYQWAPGLLIMLTSSTKEEYEKTLKQFISSTRGITQSWIKPSMLDEMKNYLIDRYNAKVYRFIGRRYRHWKYPAKVRPEYDRRLSYSGEDASETLKEMQNIYGLIPSSFDIRIDDYKMQINRNGLFVIRHINFKTVGILQELIERIVAEQIYIRNTSEKFNNKIKTIFAGTEQFKIPRIVAGKISLPNTVLSQLMINRMFHPGDPYDIGETEREDEDAEELKKKFSFLDTFVEEDPLVFTSTVVDEDKGTIFGISGTDREMAIIPKHRITFESFIRFYDFVTLSFDYDARLALFSEELLA